MCQSSVPFFWFSISIGLPLGRGVVVRSGTVPTWGASAPCAKRNAARIRSSAASARRVRPEREKATSPGIPLRGCAPAPYPATQLLGRALREQSEFGPRLDEGGRLDRDLS